jgi:Tfp pilus assembly protein PilN
MQAAARDVNMASPNELSFLPDDYLERKAQRRTNVIFAVLFLIVIAAIGSAFTIGQRGALADVKENETVRDEYTEAAKRIQLVQDLQEKQKRMAQQAELAASLLEKVPRSHILADITNSLPAGVSLLDLVMDSKVRAAPQAPKSAFEAKRGPAAAKADPKAKAAPAPPPLKVYDVNVKITGVAFTDVQVAQFISKLNDSKLLKDVNLVISDEFKEGDGDPLRKFQLEAQIDPKAEVISGTEKPKTAAVEIKEN